MVTKYGELGFIRILFEMPEDAMDMTLEIGCIRE